MTRGVFALAILAALLVGATASGADATTQPPLRVAIVVGPVGSVTDSYRSMADAAAREARRWSTDVRTVYSPDATWPAVRAALQGASIVVYLGHGNGWPSRYRDALYPPTQDGFGLNPVAGVDDTAHQYFGEAYIAREVRLAPGAVVILSHLCYASGNTEPGLPVGTLDQSVQRVDNFGAGFIAAGAAAVVAETAFGPAYYVKALLSGRRDVETIWRQSPTFNDHVLTFASRRTPGAALFLDPDRPLSGFYRSLVLVGHPVSSGSTPRAGGQAPVPVGPPPPPSLASLGVRLGTPFLDDTPVAGSMRQLTIPLTLPAGVRVAAGIRLGVRWEPLQLDTLPPAPDASPAPDDSPAPDASPASSATPSPAGSPGPSPVATPVVGPVGSPTPVPSPTSPGPTPTASASPEPSASPAPSLVPPDAGSDPFADPPEVQLVTAETAADVVDVVRTSQDGQGLTASIATPTVPGRYRLVLTLHDPDGVAYDAATQALLPTMAVRVTGRMSAAYSVATDITVPAGGDVTLPVRLTNSGSVAWGFGSVSTPGTSPAVGAGPVAVPWVMGHWVRLLGSDTAATPARGVPVLVAPGQSALAPLELTAPADVGPYLLLIDTVTPAQGSLAALGVPPAIVRVTVVAPTPEIPTRPK